MPFYLPVHDKAGALRGAVTPDSRRIYMSALPSGLRKGQRIVGKGIPEGAVVVDWWKAAGHIDCGIIMDRKATTTQAVQFNLED